MSKIVLEHIDKYYGENRVLKDINLTIEDGDFMTLLGPSGCGKTTTLRVISGLEKPQNGTMTIDGRTIIDAANAFYEDPSKRDLNLVFQSYALWPHMTVYQNISFGLKIKKLSAAEIDRRVMDSLRTMRIDQYKDRYPNELSGGQQQRVAIARAIASSPKLLLLDEPLSNLDARLRIDMRVELKRLHRETGTTIIYVTHDQVEAMTMSTKVALFRAGEIAQVATPLELYTNPIDMETADFVGSPRINLVDGTALYDGTTLKVKSPLGGFSFDKDSLKLAEKMPEGTEFPVALGIRPEVIQIATRRPAGDRWIEAEVYASQPAGSETIVTLEAQGTQFLALQVDLRSYEMNQKVWVSIDPQRVNVFNRETQRLIRYAEENRREEADA
ncbi:MAG: ABC transporter ATP-binding protein [Oscillibacter sp.]|nr:ABC transporter ATP-binding protein [Oscillibacter sp.]MBR1690856.1 ABC transporter ATP-binding protein [Oscillibacter sp.]